MDWEKAAIIGIITVIIFGLTSAFIDIIYGDTGDDILWKKDQLNDKLSQTTYDDYITYEKQMKKIQKTLDYIRAFNIRL